MKNFTSFLCMAMLVWSSYSYVGYGIVGPFTTNAFPCLADSGLGNSIFYSIIRVYQNSQSPSGIDQNALQTLTNSFVAEYASDIYVEICRGINATSQINLVNDQIITPLLTNPEANFGSILYIKVEPSINPDCSWEGYNPSDNCNYLKEATMAVLNLGQWYPTIFSTARIWERFFGSSCDTFATDTGAYLWYANYDSTGNVDSTQSFDDFVPFGGWTVASQTVLLKQIGGNVTIPLLCGNTAWHAFVDQVWFP